LISNEKKTLNGEQGAVINQDSDDSAGADSGEPTTVSTSPEASVQESDHATSTPPTTAPSFDESVPSMSTDDAAIEVIPPSEDQALEQPSASVDTVEVPVEEAP